MKIVNSGHRTVLPTLTYHHSSLQEQKIHALETRNVKASSENIELKHGTRRALSFAVGCVGTRVKSNLSSTSHKGLLSEATEIISTPQIAGFVTSLLTLENPN